MPIEFRCSQCQKLLRTPDDTAGKLAKCPDCGTVVTIPAAGAAQPGTGASSPFGAGGGVRPSGPAGPGPEGSPFGSPAGARPGDTVNPYQSPGDYAAGAGAFPGFAPAGEIRPTRIEFGDVFGRTWAIFKEQWGTCVVAILIVGGISTVLNAVAEYAPAVLLRGGDREAVAMLSMLLSLAFGLVGMWLHIGQIIFFLKVARGQRPTFDDLFSGGPYFVNYLVASILFGLILLAGLLLCFVPYVIFALMFWPYGYLIVDRRMGITESLSAAKEVTAGNKTTVFAIGVVFLVLAIPLVLAIGLPAAFVVGPLLGFSVAGLVVAPFFGLLMPVIYLSMTGQPTMGHGPFGPTPMP